jgi:hypothetical protein
MSDEIDESDYEPSYDVWDEVEVLQTTSFSILVKRVGFAGEEWIPRDVVEDGDFIEATNGDLIPIAIQERWLLEREREVEE